MKRYILALLFVLLIIVSANQSTFAQEEEESSATLEDTTTWLKSVLESQNTLIIDNGDLREEYLISEIQFYKCGMRYQLTQKVHYLKEEKIIVNNIKIYVFSLADIDPLSIELSKAKGEGMDVWRFILQTSGNKNKIGLSQSDLLNSDKSYKKYSENKLYMFVKDKDMSARVNKAIKHAIKLCGGKVDPF